MEKKIATAAAVSVERQQEFFLALRFFTKKDLPKAIWQILYSFVPFLVLWGMSYMLWDGTTIGIFQSSITIVINSFFLVLIFIVQHDCGHKSYFKSLKWNRMIGTFCSLFSTLPFAPWREEHDYHHRNTGKLDHRDYGDINFWTTDEYRSATRIQQLGYRIFRSPFVLFLVVPLYYFLIAKRNVLPFILYPLGFLYAFLLNKQNPFRYQGKWKQLWNQLFNNLFIALIYGQLVILLGWKFLVIQGLTVFAFSIIAFWFFYVQHSHEKTYQKWFNKGEWEYFLAGLQGASYYNLPNFFKIMTGKIVYHHIHHLNPAIASYFLKEAHEMLVRDFPDLYAIVQELSFKESLLCIYNKLWSVELQKYISFREFRKMENC